MVKITGQFDHLRLVQITNLPWSPPAAPAPVAQQDLGYSIRVATEDALAQPAVLKAAAGSSPASRRRRLEQHDPTFYGSPRFGTRVLRISRRRAVIAVPRSAASETATAGERPAPADTAIKRVGAPKGQGRFQAADLKLAAEMIEGMESGKFPNASQAIESYLGRAGGDGVPDSTKKRLRRAINALRSTPAVGQ